MAFDDHRDGLHQEVNENGLISQHPGYNTGYCQCGVTFLKARTAHTPLCLRCRYLVDVLNPQTADKAVG
ncbi:hypothetical protein LCGC14_1661780 [marine sediment metagenome]|uniref:Uncharacterized protein n=1 Tax=marine sediment metagenome TaxID=412755 RepID=A0A0F9KTX2_9ZZZZ